MISGRDYLSLWLMGVFSCLFCAMIPGPCGWVEFIDLLHAVFFRAGSQVLLSFKLSSFFVEVLLELVDFNDVFEMFLYNNSQLFGIYYNSFTTVFSFIT